MLPNQLEIDFIAMSCNDQSINLRPALPGDSEFAWSLYRLLMKSLTEELLEWNDERQKRVVERDIASGQAKIIVVAEQDIGWMHVREDAAGIELCQLYIAPEMQNRGIGTTIVERLMTRARSVDKIVTLEVMKNNRARSLYERLGFTQTGEGRFKLKLEWREQIDPSVL